MSEQEQSLSGKDKANWVSATVKKVYADFKSEEIARSNKLNEYSAHELAEFLFDDLEDHPAVNFDLDQMPGFDDVLNAFEFEAFGGTTTSLSTDDVVQHGFQRTELPQNPNVQNCQEGSHALAVVPDSLASGSDFNAKQENLIQQLINLQKEQQEAMFNRQLAEQHQQHLQNQQRLEERILALQRDNEYLKSTLNQVVKSLRSHFATSTEIE